MRWLTASGMAALLYAAATGPGVSFDHSELDTLLKAHVADGMVDYDAFAATPAFKAYLERLAKFDPATLPEAERLAYWINAYNAYTIELINKHGERDSIRNINRTLGLKLKGPWREELVAAGGRRYHLDNVEHDIIRKLFKEPRIHFALVCAAMGCPALRSEAYTGAKLEKQLASQAYAFLLSSPEKNRVDVASGIVHLSPILDWYREDFGGSDAELGRYLAGFHPPGPAKALLLSGSFKIESTPYDWTLNSQQKARELAKKPSLPGMPAGFRPFPLKDPDRLLAEPRMTMEVRP